MTRMAPEELAKKIGGGLLSFPVTHFKQDFAFDEAPYREHIEWLLKFAPAGLFAAGGTGEFFSLTMPEFASVVSAAVQQTNGRVPVVAGCGYGTAIAKQFAKAAETSGADGLLLLPPYLVNSEAAGLIAHVEAAVDRMSRVEAEDVAAILVLIRRVVRAVLAPFGTHREADIASRHLEEIAVVSVRKKPLEELVQFLVQREY